MERNENDIGDYEIDKGRSSTPNCPNINEVVIVQEVVRNHATASATQQSAGSSSSFYHQQQGRPQTPEVQILPRPIGGYWESGSGNVFNHNFERRPVFPQQQTLTPRPPAKRPELRPEFYNIDPNAPILGQGYSRPAGEERPGDICRKTGPKSYCFNCKGDHMVSKCSLPLNQSEIQKNRRVFRSQQGQQGQRWNTNTRYMEQQPVEPSSAFVPGQISEHLRNAMGVPPNQLPMHIYRMRHFGYPPGHLQNARAFRGLNLYDGQGSSHNNADMGYDRNKFHSYPGFNAPMPLGYHDNARRFGAPIFSSNQNVDLHWAKCQNEHMSGMSHQNQSNNIRQTFKTRNVSIEPGPPNKRFKSANDDRRWDCLPNPAYQKPARAEEDPTPERCAVPQCPSPEVIFTAYAKVLSGGVVFPGQGPQHSAPSAPPQQFPQDTDMRYLPNPSYNPNLTSEPPKFTGYTQPAKPAVIQEWPKRRRADSPSLLAGCDYIMTQSTPRIQPTATVTSGAAEISGAGLNSEIAKQQDEDDDAIEYVPYVKPPPVMVVLEGDEDERTIELDDANENQLIQIRESLKRKLGMNSQENISSNSGPVGNSTGSQDSMVSSDSGRLVIVSQESMASSGSGRLVIDTGSEKSMASSGSGRLVIDTGSQESMASSGSGRLVIDTGSQESMVSSDSGRLVIVSQESKTSSASGKIVIDTGSQESMASSGSGRLVIDLDAEISDKGEDENIPPTKQSETPPILLGSTPASKQGSAIACVDEEVSNAIPAKIENHDDAGTSEIKAIAPTTSDDEIEILHESENMTNANAVKSTSEEEVTSNGNEIDNGTDKSNDTEAEEFGKRFTELPALANFSKGMHDLYLHPPEPPRGTLDRMMSILKKGKKSSTPATATTSENVESTPESDAVEPDPDPTAESPKPKDEKETQEKPE